MINLEIFEKGIIPEHLFVASEEILNLLLKSEVNVPGIDQEELEKKGILRIIVSLYIFALQLFERRGSELTFILCDRHINVVSLEAFEVK